MLASKHRSKLSIKYNILNNFKRISSSSGDKITTDPFIQSNDRIRAICNEIEERSIRQNNLFDTYVLNIKCDYVNRKIDMKNLVKLCKFEPFDILSNLYYEGLSKTGYKPSNIFNLPPTKPIDDNLRKHIDDTSTSKEEFKNHLSETAYILSNTLEKYYMRDQRKIILHRNDYYDLANIDLDTNFSNNKVNNKVMSEVKYPDRHMDSQDIRSIIGVSASKKYYIGSLGDIFIGNTFDDSYTYDINGYDLKYGVGSFHHAILNNVRRRINLTGDESIRYHKTYDLIYACADYVAKKCNIDNDLLFFDFISNSDHLENDEYIEIGRLMDKYNIQSHELLYVMFTYNAPFSAGINSYYENIDKATTFSLDDAQRMLDKYRFSIDYLYGKPIKNNFRQKYGDLQTIHIKKFDDRTTIGHFYKCIFYIMICKIKTRNIEPNIMIDNRC